jgi:hypothetical protein
MSTSHSDYGGTPYVVGQYWNGSKGATLAEFESKTGFAMSTVVESGFLRDPSSVAHAVIAVNLAGQDIIVALDKAKAQNKNFPNVRENEREVNAFRLDAGTSSHFNVGYRAYIVHICEYVESEKGSRKRLTGEGLRLSDLENMTITIVDGEQQGLVDLTTNNANTDNYCYIENNTTRPIIITAVKDNTAYAKSNEEIQQAKMNRLPDRGGDIAFERLIKAGATAHIRPPERLFICRALQTEDQYVVPTEDSDMIVMHSRIPPKTDYAQEAEVQTTAGKIVIFFQDTRRNGSVIGKSYKPNELKFVDSDIAITKQRSARV